MLAMQRFNMPDPEFTGTAIKSRTLTLAPRLAADAVSLAPEEASGLAIKLFRDSLRSMDADRWIASNFESDEAVAFRDELIGWLAELRSPIEGESHDPSFHVEKELLRDAQRQCEPNGEAGTLLRQYVRRAQIQLAGIRLARFDGDFTDKITDAMFSRSGIDSHAISAAKSSPNAKQATVEAVAAAYLDQRLRGSLQPKTKDCK